MSYWVHLSRRDVARGCGIVDLIFEDRPAQGIKARLRILGVGSAKILRPQPGTEIATLHGRRGQRHFPGESKDSEAIAFVVKKEKRVV